MQAIALKGIRQLGLIEANRPVLKNQDDVLIEVKSIGVCGSDMHYFRIGRIGDQVVKFPFVVGHEFSGVVKEVGADAKNIKPGDRVAVDPNVYCGACDQCLSGRHHTCRNQRFMGCPGQMEGCNQPFVVMPARNCFVLPENLSFDDGMLIEPLSIGVYAAQRTGDVNGLTIGIWGYGPIGMCVHEAIKMNGAGKVYVSELLDYRGRMATKHGAEKVLNPQKEDVVKTISQNEPLLLDVAVECCGSQEAIDEAIKCIKPGGRLVLVGIPEFDHWSISAETIRRREITIINIRRQNHCEQAAIDALSSGKINLSDMVTHRLPLSEAQKAYDMVADYRDGVMKAVLYC